MFQFLLLVLIFVSLHFQRLETLYNYAMVICIRQHIFIGESHVQQAALFDMAESGSILQPDCLGASLKKVKDLLQTNTDVSFIGQKRPRPTGDQLQNKSPNGFVKKAGCSATIACLTCLKA